MSALLNVPTSNSLQYTLDAGYSAGGSTLTLNQSVSGIIQAPGVVTVDRVNSSGVPTSPKRTYYYFTGVSGAQLTGVSLADGSDQSHSVGAIVEFTPDVKWAQSIYDSLANIINPATQAVDPTKVIPTSYLDTDSSLTANSDTKIATQKATKSYVDSHSTATQINDTNSLPVIKSVATASAVDWIDVTNAATANPATVKYTANGSDSNIHIQVSGKGNGLLKTSVLRQDNTTNSYKHNSVILTGWGYIDGTGSATRIGKTISFGVTFAAAPIIIATFLGDSGNGAAPSAIGDFVNSSDDTRESRVYGISTTQFTIEAKSGSNFASGYHFGMSWMAIGELA